VTAHAFSLSPSRPPVTRSSSLALGFAKARFVEKQESVDDSRWEQQLRRYMSWAAVCGATLFALAYFVSIVVVALSGYWDAVALKHFPTVIGLPSAALAALFVVLVLRTVAGAVEFRVLGFELKGATGPIVMWVVCFLSIAFAINLLWDHHYTP